MRVGIVAEGPTDHLVLETFIAALVGQDTQFERIYPDSSLSFGGGWKGVRSWCTAYGRDLAAIMAAVKGAELTHLVIHLDADVTDDPDIGVIWDCPPPSTSCASLRAAVGGWIGMPQPFIVIATPSRFIETWVVAALEPLERVRADLECDPLVDRILLRGNRLRTRAGRVQKDFRRYEQMMPEVSANIAGVFECSEAVGFWERFLAAKPFV